MRSATQSSFPKSMDRFRDPKKQSPPATRYSVKDGLNFNFSSVRKNMGQTRIGTNTRSFIDERWGLGDAQNQPGPGSYEFFSETMG